MFVSLSLCVCVWVSIYFLKIFACGCAVIGCDFSLILTRIKKCTAKDRLNKETIFSTIWQNPQNSFANNQEDGDYVSPSADSLITSKINRIYHKIYGSYCYLPSLTSQSFFCPFSGLVSVVSYRLQCICCIFELHISIHLAAIYLIPFYPFICVYLHAIARLFLSLNLVLVIPLLPLVSLDFNSDSSTFSNYCYFLFYSFNGLLLRLSLFVSRTFFFFLHFCGLRGFYFLYWYFSF